MGNKKIKKFVFRMLSLTDRVFLPNRLFITVISLLIVINIVTAISGSYKEIYDSYHQLFYAIELVSILIFTLEYAARIWTADLLYPKLSRSKATIRFITSPLGIIDIIAIIPFYLSILVFLQYDSPIDLIFIRSFRILTLLRFLTFSKHGVSMRVFVDVIRDLRFELTATFFLIGITIVVAATVMFNLESEARPQHFKNMGDAFWWAVVTLTTVGYGDVYPVTMFGRVFGGIVAILGIGLFVIPATLVSASFIQKMKEHKWIANKNQGGEALQFKYCPHCGKKLPEH